MIGKLEEVEREEEEMRRKLALQVAAIQGEEMEEDQKATGGAEDGRTTETEGRRDGKNSRRGESIGSSKGEGTKIQWGWRCGRME